MKKVNEIREIMEQAKVERVNRLVEIANDYCEKVTEELMPLAAKNGDNFIVIKPMNEIIGLVMDILKSNGYSWAKVNDKAIKVMW